jgi:hypothetical protein
MIEKFARYHKMNGLSDVGKNGYITRAQFFPKKEVFALMSSI